MINTFILSGTEAQITLVQWGLEKRNPTRPKT